MLEITQNDALVLCAYWSQVLLKWFGPLFGYTKLCWVSMAKTLRILVEVDRDRSAQTAFLVQLWSFVGRLKDREKLSQSNYLSWRSLVFTRSYELVYFLTEIMIKYFLRYCSRSILSKLIPSNTFLNICSLRRIHISNGTQRLNFPTLASFNKRCVLWSTA